MITDYDGGESGRIFIPETSLPVFPVSRNVSMSMILFGAGLNICSFFE